MDFRPLSRTAKGTAAGKISEKWIGLFFSALCCLVLPTAFCAAQGTGLDLEGRSVNPLRSNAGQIVVLIFVREDCPVSGRYAPTIQNIRDQHKEARFYLVFPDKDETPANIRKYLRDFGYSIPALRDPRHALVNQAHAQITPEAAVFDARGDLVYHGRIDNLYETFGRARPAPTTHELEDAIQAIRTGHSPATKEVAAIGCYISDLR
jgi:hypothetical protein